MSEKSPEIHQLIRERASSRVYDPNRPVPAEMIDLLLESARWAPSAGNSQPWRYLVFDDRIPSVRESARNCLDPGNLIWASRAPVLILAVAAEKRLDGRPLRNATHDLGLANQNVLLQAIALGLCCRPMAGFDKQKAAEVFHIPEGHRAMVMIAVGFEGNLQDLEAEVQKKETRPRTRHTLDTFAFHGEWDTPYPHTAE